MFGTLVSNESGQEALDFIENPDPVAAVSRNIQVTKHVACMSCRSKKVRFRQRALGDGQDAKAADAFSPQTAESSRKSPTAVARCGADESAERNEASHGQTSELNDLHDKPSIDSDTGISGPLAEIVYTPTQHNSDGGIGSNTTENIASTSDITTSESSHSTNSDGPPCQFPGSLHTDTFLSSLLSPSHTENIVEMHLWEEIYSTNDCDMPWITNPSDGDTAAGPLAPKPPPRESSGGRGDCGAKTQPESESCSCLLSSITFLEKLACKSVSCESRIDLMLADIRNSMTTLAAFIACEKCAARAELTIVLAMSARKIGIICGRLANSYKHLRGLSSSDTKSDAPSYRHHFDRGASTIGPIDISVSTYSVDQREGLHLLQSLTSFQTIELQQHINTIKSRYPHQPNQGQARALTEAEDYIKSAQATISSYSP
ncbi:C6 zinc finger domain-containing protein [Fusarium mexicanum]|uniref:C6 zinc finger domain-containing protein n=1 Tax=Fusarium mexicanum TaxID=751941 RepID=A0A8H5MNX3_9HYPO|nr:C6 zinc finger domain-containing protein [Fusarium mexicanum]